MFFNFGKKEEKPSQSAKLKPAPSGIKAKASNSGGQTPSKPISKQANSNSKHSVDDVSEIAEVRKAVGVRKMIETLDEVPASQGLLTIGAKAVMKVPKEFEFDIIAIELGLKRVTILYNPAAASNPNMKSVMSSLRNKLISDGFNFESGGDYPCSSAVIKLMLDDYLSKNGIEANGDINKIKSMAKDRFLGWLDMAVQEGATDLHVQVVGQSRAVVQLRIDGELENMRDSRKGIYTELEAMESMAWPFNSGSAKGSNNSAQWEAARNLYCMTDARVVKNKQIALRYQSLRGHLGPKMIARLLNVDTNAPTLTYAQLGYSESQRLMMLDVSNMPSGFVIFAGVTGSGKTTTLKTFIETHPGNGTMAIYSMEDPVEYPLRGVHQIALQRDISNVEGSKRMYNEVVASLMRADPDIVIVGEIRDGATAGAGQQIVETGHMALGTVHAHLISGIVPRLTNEEIGMSRDVLTNPNMLSLLAYQALTPKLCIHCRMEGDEAVELARESDSKNPDISNEAKQIGDIIEAIGSRFSLNAGNMRYKRVGGCEQCNFRGTKGVTVVAEMVIPDRKWLEYTRDGKDYEAMIHYRQMSDKRFDTDNMNGKTIFEHTLSKAFKSEVDPRQCERFDNFKRFDTLPFLRNSDLK